MALPWKDTDWSFSYIKKNEFELLWKQKHVFTGLLAEHKLHTTFPAPPFFADVICGWLTYIYTCSVAAIRLYSLIS